MSRVARKKTDSQSTAAYAASQPLFDALRNGSMRLHEQTTNLTTARDIVQQLHVKLPHQDSQDETDRYQRSIDCAVKAWRSATTIYADIFDSLAKVTASDASVGQVKKHGHADFKEMAKTASAARDVAMKFKLFEEERKVESASAAMAASDGEQSENSEEDSGSDKMGLVDQRANENLRSLPSASLQSKQEKRKQAEKQQELLQELARVKRNKDRRIAQSGEDVENSIVDPESRKREQKRMLKMLGQVEQNVQRRQKKEKMRAAELAKSLPERRAPAKMEGVSEPSSQREKKGADEPEPVSAAFGMKVDPIMGVQYKDVSAEVDARLKAKAEKRSAAKKEKKRKRQSGESIEAAEADAKVEKPNLKKFKGEPANEDLKGAAKKEKRGKHERAPEEAAERERRKKQKKA